MGAQILEILRQGVWASLTGGWFYDPHQSIFSNTFHLYIWLFLLCLPLSLYLYFPPSLVVRTIYALIIGIVFAAIKTVNYRLHAMFDTTECVDEPVDDDSSSGGSDSSGRSDNCADSKLSSGRNVKSSEVDGIEMTVLNSGHGGNSTPPVRCSSRNSFLEDAAGGQLIPLDTMKCISAFMPRESLECISELLPKDAESKTPSSTIDLKVDVHRNNSSGSSEDGVLKPLVEAAGSNMTDFVSNGQMIQAQDEERLSKTTATLQNDVLHFHKTEPKIHASPHFSEASASGGTVLSLTAGLRFGNVSNLARSFAGDSSSSLSSAHALQCAGSLELGHVLEDLGSRRSNSGNGLGSLKSRRERDRRLVRRTCSAIDAGAQVLHPVTPMQQPSTPLPSHPVSLDAITVHPSQRRHSVTAAVSAPNAALATASSPALPAVVKCSNSDNHFHIQMSISEDIQPVVECQDESLVNNSGTGKMFEINLHPFRTSSGGGRLPPSACIISSSSLEPRLDNLESDMVGGRSTYRAPSFVPNPLLVAAGRSFEKMYHAFKSLHSPVSERSRRDHLVMLRSRRRSAEDSPVHSDRTQGRDLDHIVLRNRAALELRDQEPCSLDRVGTRLASRIGRDATHRKLSWGRTTEAGNDSTAYPVYLLSPLESPVWTDGCSLGESSHINSIMEEATSQTRDTSSNSSLSPHSSLTKCRRSSDGRPLATEEPSQLDSFIEMIGNNEEANYEGETRTPPSGCNGEVSEHLSLAESLNDAAVVDDGSANFLLSSSSPCPSPMAQSESTSGPSPPNQGAIPKQKPSLRHHLANDAGASPSSPVSPAYSNIESDLNDPSILSRRLIEILNKHDRDACERELHKLKEQLDLQRKHESTTHREPHTENKRKNSNEPHSSRLHRVSARRRRHRAGNTPTTPSVASELSSLLPSTPNEMHDEGTGRGNKWRSTSAHDANLSPAGCKDRSGPPFAALASVLSSPGTHLASSHDDTSSGAVHCFQDERGNWLTYTFDQNSNGVATNLVSNSRPLHNIPKWETASQASTSSGSTVILDSPATVLHPQHHQLRNVELIRIGPRRDSGDVLSIPISSSGQSVVDGNVAITTFPRNIRLPFQLSFPDALLERTARPAVSVNEAPSSHAGTVTDTDVSSSNKLHFASQSRHKPKHYYKFRFLPCRSLKVRFDRLALLAMLDRNLTVPELVLSVALAVLVGVLGTTMLLTTKFFQDFWIFLFCFVMASCQYSVLKSVQPDAASPIHGYNRIVALSRPIYFCICCILTLGLSAALERKVYPTAFTLYGIQFTSQRALIFARDFLIVFLLCFPILFSFGLLPQINTFFMYLLEQIDVHVLGGNATTSLISAFYCILRSLLAVVVLYGFAYGALREQMSSQHIMFSIFCGLLVSLCYHLSRCSSDPTVLWSILKTQMWPVEDQDKTTTAEGGELVDPLPAKLRATVLDRLKSDAIICPLAAVVVFAVHVSTVFTTLQPLLNSVLYCITAVIGIITHYLTPQFRTQLPWLCFSHPLCKSHEYRQFEVRDAAKVMWFERLYVWFWLVERAVVYPVIFLSALTHDSPLIVKKFGVYGAALVVVICSLKCLRSAFSHTSRHYQVLIFTYLFFAFDFKGASETFLVDYFVMSIVLSKVYDLLLKVRFIITYIAPWQITWGSAFHAFAQPFSVPHSAMLFVQAAVSAILSTPLNPILGSAIFITSYVRPVKFWERDYNTKRVDHTNTRLSTHLERNPVADDNNLNSIFYEHLTRSLQHSLAGDLALGRWGMASQGDCFVLASDYLNCLVHIIEVGNGLVTFQMRGLEFRGTYCQQREVEAICEGVEDDDGCCCCEPGHLSHMLSINAAFAQRWLAWEVIATKYVLEGYSITDNSAASMFQVFDLRKVLITYYVKSVVYYAIRSPKLNDWLNSEAITEALKSTIDKHHADLDPVFNMNVDEDYDFRASGVTRNSFCNVYLYWIQYCCGRRDKTADSSRDSPLVTLCYALSLLGRRTLGAAAHNSYSSVDFFLYGLHALFKGDFRITSVRDEWVFNDMELLRKVVAPGIRMALKLHQDHFTSPDEYDDPSTLYEAISAHEANLVISHEGDPAWRNAVLSNMPSLLALRHVVDDGSDEYKIIMLNRRHLSFRVIKVNRECVRGLWAGQQQELVYLRNRNPERGSIQNAKQALRNLINSSCDQPIGYPIYVSPLTTSFADANAALQSIVGGTLTFATLCKAVMSFWRRIRRRCGESCSSGGSVPRDSICGNQDGGYSTTPCIATSVHSIQSSQNTSSSQSGDGSIGVAILGGSGSVNHALGNAVCNSGNSGVCAAGSGRGSLGHGSLGGSSSSGGKPSSSTLASLSLGGLHSDSGSLRDSIRDSTTSVQGVQQHLPQLCNRERELQDTPPLTKPYTFGSCGRDRELRPQRVRIVDPAQVCETLNPSRRVEFPWLNESLWPGGGRTHWKGWTPKKGMEGWVVCRWALPMLVPLLPIQQEHLARKSHLHTSEGTVAVVLVKIEDKYVPIAESGIQNLGAEV